MLTAAEAEAVLAGPPVDLPFGVRDRAILEVLYSTGIRRAELNGLTVWDLDRDRGLLTVRKGKGGKDRIIPIGERAAAWVARYAAEVRPSLVVPPDAGILFLTGQGLDFTPDHLSGLAARYINKANVGKRGACHVFRHTCATLMLEGGADLRYVQEMLGHADTGTTTIYTHVAVGALKAVHTATHPAATNRPHPQEGPDSQETEAAVELLAAIDAEADDEETSTDPQADPR